MAQDDGLAASLYRQGCEGGHVGGCAYLGDMLERGAGVAQDLEQAVARYREGCAGGEDYGCRALERLGRAP